MVPRRIVPLEDGLSGLAKAFFYAGSRALLVSHWPVSSDVTVTLIARMFGAFANDNAIGRSEALKRSMLGLMNDNTHAPIIRIPPSGLPSSSSARAEEGEAGLAAPRVIDLLLGAPPAPF